MDTQNLLLHLESEGRQLAAALHGPIDWDAAVPGLTWDLRALVVHTGAVHRWACDAVERRLSTNETGGSAAFADRIPDHALPQWIADGHAALVATLRSTPDDAEVFTLLPGAVPRAFWIRRQAHETAIHRADVQACTGVVEPFDRDFAQDGIAELVAGFALEEQFAVNEPGTLALHCTDGPSWLVEFGDGPTRGVVSEDLSTASATVTGTSAALDLWIWNRPADVMVQGDPRTIASWQRIRI